MIYSDDIVKHNNLTYKVIDVNQEENTARIVRKGEVEIIQHLIKSVDKKVKKEDVPKYIVDNFEEINPEVHFTYQGQLLEGVIDNKLKKQDLIKFLKLNNLLKEISIKSRSVSQVKKREIQTITMVASLNDLELIKKHSKTPPLPKSGFDISELSLEALPGDIVSPEKKPQIKRLYRPPKPRIEQFTVITDENLNEFYIKESQIIDQETITSFQKLPREEKINILFALRVKAWSKEIGRINTLEEKILQAKI